MASLFSSPKSQNNEQHAVSPLPYPAPTIPTSHTRVHSQPVESYVPTGTPIIEAAAQAYSTHSLSRLESKAHMVDIPAYSIHDGLDGSQDGASTSNVDYNTPTTISTSNFGSTQPISTAPCHDHLRSETRLHQSLVKTFLPATLMTRPWEFFTLYAF
jgi:hypothetical protein